MSTEYLFGITTMLLIIILIKYIKSMKSMTESKSNSKSYSIKEQKGGASERDEHLIFDLPIVEGDKYINNLEVLNSFPTSKPEQITNNDKQTYHVFDDLDFDIDGVDIDNELKNKVLERQPYILGSEPKIINSYNKKYYWDYKYPKQPIPIEFLMDTEKFCLNNKSVYPCPEIYARIKD